MIKDHYYDLLSQLVTEHRSLWRIRKYYLKNAKTCKTCARFFKELIKEKSQTIENLNDLLKRHKSIY